MFTKLQLEKNFILEALEIIRREYGAIILILETSLYKLQYILLLGQMIVNMISKVTFLQKPNMKGWSMRIFFPFGGSRFTCREVEK